MIFIVSASFSSANAVSSGRVVLFPVEPSIMGYQRVFENERVWTGYANTILYTGLGTLINVFYDADLRISVGSEKLPRKGGFYVPFTFTMLFSGGMIPSYLVMRDLKILNTVWVMVLPGAIGISQMIVTRTFLRSTIPDELLEATQIDGCNDFRFFTMFVLPLSKAVIAVIAMQYAIGHWNSYFNAMIYLSDSSKYPLQIFLREILIMNDIDTSDIVDEELAIAMQEAGGSVKIRSDRRRNSTHFVHISLCAEIFRQGRYDGLIEGINAMKNITRKGW